MKTGLDISELEKILDRTQEWIRAADQKISIFLAFEGIIIALIFFPILSWVKQLILQFDYLIFLLIYLSSFLLLYGLVKMIFVLSSILRIKQKKGNSFTYFADIALSKFEDYKNRVNTLTKKDYKNELINQIFISSDIAYRKHTHFKDSLLLFFLGFFLLFIALIYFIYKYGI